MTFTRNSAAFFWTRFFALIVTVLVALFMWAQAPNAHAQNTSSQNKVTGNVAPLRGTLYRIDHQNHSAWLFGTIHVGHTGFYPLEPQVMRALHEADTLVIEVDIRKVDALQKAMKEYAFYRDGKNLSNQLSHDALQKLKDGLREAGVPFDAVMTMKPWMIANVLIIQSMAQSGYPAEQGIEQYFLSIATQEKKSVQELETADYQLALFDRMTPAQQEAYLLDTLKDLKSGAGVQKGVSLIQAWSRADGPAMELQKRQMVEEDSTSARFTENVLLNERNPDMANGIERLIRNKQKIFVAVGTLHLLGDNSVPALLKQRGYRVTKIY